MTRSLGLLAGLLLALAAGPAPGDVPRGDPAARLLPAEHASDVWDLTVALDHGAWVVAQITVSNVGPGDRTGAAVGHVLAADGTPHEFHKVRSAGGWSLSEDRRRIDLDSILFDQRGEVARFYVSKKRVDLDLRIDLTGESAWSPALTGDAYGFDLLALAAPVRGILELRDGAGPREVRGAAILTHRWMDGLESRWVDRRVELFGVEDGGGMYFTEVTAPDRTVRRWLVVARDGRIVDRSDEVELGRDGGGSLELSTASSRGRLSIGPELLRDQPLERAPLLARWWVGRWTRPRFVWSAARFDFEAGRAPATPVHLAGRGLLGVSRFDASDAPPAGPADLWRDR
jgi:hypothetical protein